jgi:hypothetical protein
LRSWRKRHDVPERYALIEQRVDHEDSDQNSEDHRCNLSPHCQAPLAGMDPNFCEENEEGPVAFRILARVNGELP